MNYQPNPIDTEQIELSPELVELIELLAENAHDNWALRRIEEGWTYGSKRDDHEKKHPDLVPYDDLPDSEKEYDRKVIKQTIKALLALGFKIVKE